MSESTHDRLVITLPHQKETRASDVIRLRPEDAIVLAKLQARTGINKSELAGMLIRWAADRVEIKTAE